MRTRDDARMWPALALAVVLFAAGCADGDAPPVSDTGTVSSTSAAMTADSMAPAGTCTEAGTTDTVPCMGLDNGTTVTLKVVPPPDSGSTSTVPFKTLAADCADSGSTSNVPCTVVVKKK